MYLVAMVKASEVFPGPDSDERIIEVRHWLKTKGVRDFESVSLFCDQLTKVGPVMCNQEIYSLTVHHIGNGWRDRGIG